MLTRKNHFFVIAVASAILSFSPLSIAGAATAMHSFGEIEFRSDSAALVDAMRADIAAHMPIGSSVDSARNLLSNAGARCHPAKADGSIRCSYYGAHFQGDVVEPVSWTVDLATAGDKVQSFTLVRR